MFSISQHIAQAFLFCFFYQRVTMQYANTIAATAVLQAMMLFALDDRRDS
jgi:hypothetical protein